MAHAHKDIACKPMYGQANPNVPVRVCIHKAVHTSQDMRRYMDSNMYTHVNMCV